MRHAVAIPWFSAYGAVDIFRHHEVLSMLLPQTGAIVPVWGKRKMYLLNGLANYLSHA
ncbi:MAG TPA: hypothetical protein VFV38_16035 [Ktedonobacteraceae bacterium]|nr:hypothetical protein [Ktedonobacteraceae bacterium]